LGTGSQQINAQDALPADYNGYLIYTEYGVEIVQTKDLYKQVSYTFQNPLLVLFYLISMAELAFFLIHACQSAFQTLDFNHRRYIGVIKCIGIWVFGVIIPVAFALMPVYFYLKGV